MMARVATTLVLALVLALLGPVRELLAHGVLQRSAPASNARLATVPRELRLTFNEPVERAVALLELVGPGGRAIALGPLVIPADSARQLVAAITGPMTAGRYTVRWRIAGRDGHPVRGEFAFVVAPGADGAAASLDAPPPVIPASPPMNDTAAVATPMAAAAPATTGATHHDPASFPTRPVGFDVQSPLYAAVRWLQYLALLGLIGAVVFRHAVLGRMPQASVGESVTAVAESGAARIGFWCSLLLLVVALLRLAAQSVAMHGVGSAADFSLMLPMIRGTLWGWGWLLQVAAAVVALTGFRLARRGAGRRGWGVAAVGGVLAAVAPALSGHAAAVERWTGLAIVADTLHVIGAAGWLGSLALLLFAGIPAALRLDTVRRGPVVAELMRAFSPTALGFAALLGLTGLVAAWLHLGSVPALWTSEYGRVLLVKLGMLAVVALIGAWNWRVAGPMIGRAAVSDDGSVRRLRRSAAAEVAVAVLVVAVTAVLVATPPPAGEGHDVGAGAPPQEGYVADRNRP